MSNILFACDASAKIGFGHVSRCLTLARELQDQHDAKIMFAMLNDEQSVGRVGKDYPVIEFDESRSVNYHIWLGNQLSVHSIDFLILDIRGRLDRSMVREMRKDGLKIVTIDDPEDKRLETNLAFYPPVPQVYDMDWSNMYGEWFSGWEYVIVDPQFVELQIQDIKREKNSILITMGWSDPEGMTVKILQALSFLTIELDVTVLLGGNSVWLGLIEKIASKSKHKVRIIQDSEDRARIMSTHELAICSFGTTTYELLTLGVPLMILSLTPDHESSATVIGNVGAGLSLGQYSQFVESGFASQLGDMISDQFTLSSMRRNALSVKIGYGSKKISEMITLGAN